jgi:AIPR protein
MNRYTFLLNILDSLRNEGIEHKHHAKYGGTTPEELNQARARAFIHLFLKVKFGLLEFAEREHYVTDGAYDGGIDGYFLAHEAKTIYLIQSKFRTSKDNFAEKEISLDEILVMDIDRVSKGEESDENGNKFNGKILQLEREISEIADVGRWKYSVVLLANLHGYSEGKLKQLTGGFPVTIYDSEECYEELVFPVISGTYYSAPELSVHLDLSKKYTGTKISYTVSTKLAECEITVVFVPISEIAQVMHKYKNSILRFNPRSYLEMEGKKVNEAIRNTVLKTQTNEFALFNNGITMLSDSTDINERVGQRNKAQLTLVNPQIINGGQTAYTLSRIHEELTPEKRAEAFAGKEVLLKVITLIEESGETISAESKEELIDLISSATNQQTTVINADKFANDRVFIEIQRVLFKRYSLLFERKRGEFADGLHKGYVKPDQIIERNLFFRLYLAVRGEIADAVKKRLFMRFERPEQTIEDPALLDKVAFSYWLYKAQAPRFQKGAFSERDRQVYSQLFVLANRKTPDDSDSWESSADSILANFYPEWRAFVDDASVRKRNFWRNVVDPKTGLTTTRFSAGRWMGSSEFVEDVKNWFGVGAYPKPSQPYLAESRKDRSETEEERELRKLEKQKLIPVPQPPINSAERENGGSGQPK